MQKPECNLIFTEFYIGKVETSAKTEQATASVIFENNIITVNTDDYSLNTHTVRLRIYINTSVIATEPLIVDVEFVSPPP